jgi:hypothetical protein
MGAQPASYVVAVSLCCLVAFGTNILREFLGANTVERFVNILVRAISRELRIWVEGVCEMGDGVVLFILWTEDLANLTAGIF